MLNVYGTGLSLVNEGFNNYGLSGTLENGTVLPADTTISIFNAPRLSCTRFRSQARWCWPGWDASAWSRGAGGGERA